MENWSWDRDPSRMINHVQRDAPRLSDAQKAFVVVNHIDKGDKAPSSVLVLATVSAAKVAMVFAFRISEKWMVQLFSGYLLHSHGIDGPEK